MTGEIIFDYAAAGSRLFFIGFIVLLGLPFILIGLAARRWAK